MSCALKKGTKNSLSVVKGADMRKYVRKTEHTGLTVWITGEFRVETPTPHSFKYLKEEEGEYRDICLKAYNLHFDSAKKYTEYGSSTTLTFCFTDIDVDGKDELIIFSPYWGTCGFRIYDIRETPRDIRLKPVSKTDFDEARRLLVAPEEGVLLVWWRGCIVKFKMQKNADHSVSGFKYIDEVCSPGPSDFFLTYTLEEPD